MQEESTGSAPKGAACAFFAAGAGAQEGVLPA